MNIYFLMMQAQCGLQTLASIEEAERHIASWQAAAQASQTQQMRLQGLMSISYEQRSPYLDHLGLPPAGLPKW